MTKNVGTIDRIIRAVIGLALIGYAIWTEEVWAWIGVIPLLTAVVSFCPLYRLIGVRTATE